MIQLYHSLIHPHLIYAITIWGTHHPNATYIQPIIRLQKKIIRIIMNRPPHTHTKPLMTKHNILNITNLYIQRVCTELHPFVHNTTTPNRPDHHHQYTKLTDIHPHHTRSAAANTIHRPNPKNHKHSTNPAYNTNHFPQIYMQIWNSLPQPLRDQQSLPTFKRHLKQHLCKLQNK